MIHVDVRIVTSTNQNLKEKISLGHFRQDFYYRLNVLPIELPPLRSRREDIPLIANHLLEKHCEALKKPEKKISTELMDIFLKRRWTGNIRELENVILRGILFSTSPNMQPEDAGLSNEKHGRLTDGDELCEYPYKEAKEETLKRFNAGYVGYHLKKCQGNVTQAAKLCGLERQALQQIMRRFNIDAEPFRKQGEN
jgi:DNA-binding NtrC family response regulator